MAKTLEQILENEKPEVVIRAREIADEMLFNIHLADLRNLVEKKQIDIAKALKIKQPSVAEMEKPGRDLKLSSLKRYIEAIGGKLRIDIELPDGTHYGFSV